MQQVYIVDFDNKEVALRPISEEDPLIGDVRTFLVRIPQRFFFWTREKVFSIKVLFAHVPDTFLDEQKLFTERLARQLATTAAHTASPTLYLIIGFLLGAVSVFVGGKWL